MSGILPQNGRASGVNVMMPVVIVIGVARRSTGNVGVAASMQAGNLDRICGRPSSATYRSRPAAYACRADPARIVDADNQPAAFGTGVNPQFAVAHGGAEPIDRLRSGSGRVVR